MFMISLEFGTLKGALAILLITCINDLMTCVYEVFIFKSVCYYSKDES